MYYLPGRGKHKNYGSITPLQVGLVVAMDDTGKSVAEGFARSGLSNPDKVMTLERNGEALGLDWRRSGEASVADLLHDVVGEVAVLPPHDRVGAVLLTLDDHDLILVPIITK